MKRRDFIALAGATATAVALPRFAFGQAAKVPRVVIATDLQGDQFVLQTTSVKEGLAALGWIDGKNIALEIQPIPSSAEIPALLAKVVSSKPDVIVAIGRYPAHGAKAATATIPIVFTNVSEGNMSGMVGTPYTTPLVSSYAHPGGNLSGNFVPDTTAKRLLYLTQIVPNLKRFAYLSTDPAVPQTLTDSARVAATALGLEPVIFDLYFGKDHEERIATQFDGIVAAGLSAALANGVTPNDSLMFDLAMRNKIAVMGFGAGSRLAGQLRTAGNWNVATYSADVSEALLRSASFVDAILKGAKPADLPVETATKFRLVVNLDAARKVGVTIPPSMLLEADEIIDYDMRAPQAGAK